jgi:hypothetical protein
LQGACSALTVPGTNTVGSGAVSRSMSTRDPLLEGGLDHVLRVGRRAGHPVGEPGQPVPFGVENRYGIARHIRIMPARFR